MKDNGNFNELLEFHNFKKAVMTSLPHKFKDVRFTSFSRAELVIQLLPLKSKDVRLTSFSRAESVIQLL